MTSSSDPAAIDAPSYASILAAAERLRGRAVHTPLLESPLLNRAAGRRILVKAECLQRTGSFKFRGAWSHLSAFGAARLAGGVIAVSSGNHAQGVASAAELLGVPATIVMPDDAPALKKSNTAAYGAQLHLYDRAGGVDREALVRRLAQESGAHLTLPFDDALVISGQGTVGLELVEQARAAGVYQADVLVCCGGGGLASGVALALEGAEFEGRVRSVEPVGFDDWARSLAAGRIERNTETTGSICDAIMTPSPGDLPWAVGRRLFGPGLAVSDRDARRAMAAAFRHLKIVLEPGGAVALAAALFDQGSANAETPVIAVASGGNVDATQFAEWISFPEWSETGLPL
ncbi:MAG: pyridoxal-phosphate dependent enzyme [Neomegalonema sp.]|nr:pyridoxal-phosphate dependent enzyme [Neomegalonema sp.]